MVLDDDLFCVKDYIIVPRGLVSSLVALCKRNELHEVDALLKSWGDLDMGNFVPENKALHYLVRIQRKKFKISQIELAKEAKMKQPDISSFEKNGGEGFDYGRRLRISNAMKKIIQDRQSR